MNRTLGLVILSIAFFLVPQSGVSMAKADISNQVGTARQRSTSIFPILMYDSDIGLGFGGKGLVRNLFRKNESLDLILFGSTKGEQWYVFRVSVPDYEIRQGSRYPLALDLKLEYDKLLKSNFFGLGNNSKDNNWQFPRESAKIELTLGHAFTERIIGEMGLFFNHTSVYGFEDINPVMSANVPGAGETLTSYLTARIRWDTRDSQIHPHEGWKLGLNSDLASKSLGGEYNFKRFRLECSKYQKLFSPDHILAVRLWIQHIDGTAPYYEQSIIGGGWTARGYKADRFIDQDLALVSMEYRFLIYGKTGGVLFVDSGRVYPSIKKASFHNWKTDCGFGLRYYLANFVVRFDTGISQEGTRIFFNFGHVF